MNIGRGLLWLENVGQYNGKKDGEVLRSPKLDIVIKFASHKSNDMTNVRDGGCHHGRFLYVSHDL